MNVRALFATVVVSFVFAATAEAQSFEAAVHFSSAGWSEFEGYDLGLGGRLTWKPSSMIGIDADLTWYPRNYPSDSVPFSASRLEGLFGVTVGPRLVNRRGLRPFVSAGAGFVRSSAAPEPFPCVAIFPPPLACLMAAGHTMPAYQIGGGLEINTSEKTFVHVDAADRIVKYPGPTFRNGLRERVDGDFFGHAIRFTVGGGLRF